MQNIPYVNKQVSNLMTKFHETENTVSYYLLI